MKDGFCVVDESTCEDHENCKTCAKDHEGENELCFLCETGYALNEDGDCEQYNDCADGQEGCALCWGEDGKGDCATCTSSLQVPDGKKCVDDTSDWWWCLDDNTVASDNCYICDDLGEGKCLECDCGYHLDGKTCEKGNQFNNSANTVAIFAIVALLMIISM